MRFFLKLLRPLVLMNYRYPLAVLLCSASIAVVSGYFATQLVVDTDLASLLPKDHHSVRALEELRETVGGETVVEVALYSPEFETNKAFAFDFIPRAMSLRDSRSNDYFVNRYEFRRDVEILEKYAIYLSTVEEIEEIIEYLREEREEARLKANPFFFDFEEDFEEEASDQEDLLEKFEASYRELIPAEYPVSEDSTRMILRFFPTGSQNDLRFIRDLFNAFEELIAEMDPASYHPDMVVRSGGRLERHLMELDSILNDVLTSFRSGITGVVLLVALYFMIKKMINYRRGHVRNRRYGLWAHLIRMPVPILVIGIPLFFSLCLTFGITYFVYGTLNTMTSVLFVILFGLGIDYGIHFYARYLEKRSAGENIRNALLNTYDHTGAAIMISASTTAVALFVLIVADFRGFSEFGFISGLGIVLAYLSMLFIMPAIIVLLEKHHWILINKNEYLPGNIAGKSRPFPFSKTIFIAGTFIVGLVLVQTDRLNFEYNFGNLEPEFPRFEEYREIRGNVGQTGRRNPAYILADTDDQILEILQILRDKKSSNPQSTILAVEALQERFPVNEQEEQWKLARIAEIRQLINDPFLVDAEGEHMDILRKASEVTEPLRMENVPEFLKNRFITREGEMGRFVMIYPSVGLSDGRNSIAFKNEIGRVVTSDGEVFHAASTSIVAAEMLELMRKESPYMVAATFLMIFILVNIGFYSLRWSIIAMIPLLVGLCWTFAMMMIFDLSFNMYNLVVLPAILGIGNDNGVHLASRYREEGRKSMSQVLRSTGQHISVGSFTTMLGFAGLVLTHHPGLTSIGILAVIGIGLTLLSALTYLPSLVQLLENRGWIRF